MPEPFGLPHATSSPRAEALCAALDEVGIGAAELSPEGAWLTVNQRICQVTGFTADEIRATSPDALLNIDRTAVVSAAPRACSSESRVEKKDGRLAWIRSATVPVRDPATGVVGSLLVVVEDVTSQKTAQQAAQGTSRQEVAGRLINALEVEPRADPRTDGVNPLVNCPSLQSKAT